MKARRHRNSRKSQSLSVMTGKSLHVVGIIAALVVMVVVNLVAQSSCSQTVKAIREKEKLLARLEQDRRRESAAWKQMVSPENLERALVRHGLNMRLPKPEQVVRMDASGKPRYGQPSVRLAQQRRDSSGSVATNSRTRSRRR